MYATSVSEIKELYFQLINTAPADMFYEISNGTSRTRPQLRVTRDTENLITVLSLVPNDYGSS